MFDILFVEGITNFLLGKTSRISSSMEKVVSNEYPKISSEQNNINNKAGGEYSEFKRFIKSNKIPEYAREYKREYQFIRGLNKEFGYFTKKLKDLNNGLFETDSTNKIKYYMKRFIRGQEKGKFKNISNLILPDNFSNHINFINEQFGYYKLRYDAFCDDSDDDSDSFSNIFGDSDSDSDEYNDDSDSEYLVDGKPYPGFIEFYNLFKQIYNQIKQDDVSNEYESDYSDDDYF